MLLLYILWDDWPMFMISGSNEQLQQQLEYTLLKSDCHSWWISKLQSGCEDTLEERYAIKFCFKLGKNATETYGMLQTAFRPFCMNWSSVFGWHKRFKNGRESVRDDERCGRSKEVRTLQLIGQIKNFMDKDHLVSIETISAQFDVSVGTVHTIIHEELKMRKICAKFVSGCSEKIRKKDVVMTTGRWSSWSIQIPQFLMLWWPAMKARSTAMTKRQSSQWKHAGSTRPKKVRQSKSTHKLLMILFFFFFFFFLTALAWSTCTGFPLDRQSTRNTILRF